MCFYTLILKLIFGIRSTHLNPNIIKYLQIMFKNVKRTNREYQVGESKHLRR